MIMKKNELVTMATDSNLKNLQVIFTYPAKDVTNSSFVPALNVIRICAIEDSRIKKDGDTGDGILIPAGCIDYFSVNPGDSFSLTGSANIMGIEI